MKSSCFVVLLLLVAAVAENPSPSPRAQICRVCGRLASAIAGATDTSSGPVRFYLATLQRFCSRIPGQQLKASCLTVVDQAKTAIESATGQTEGLCDAVCNDGLTGTQLEDLATFQGFGEVSSVEENAFPTCRYCKMLFSLIKSSLDLDSLLDQAKTSITSICVMAGVGDEKDCKEAVDEAAGSFTFPDAKSACVTARLCGRGESVLTT